MTINIDQILAGPLADDIESFLLLWNPDDANSRVHTAELLMLITRAEHHEALAELMLLSGARHAHREQERKAAS